MSKTLPKKDDVPESVTDKERLIFIFQTLIKEGVRYPLDGVLVIDQKKLNVKPYFDDDIYPGFSEQAFCEWIIPIQNDKDFYRRYHMENYKPNFSFDSEEYFLEKGVVFIDFTDDFMKLYLENRLGIKTDLKINGNASLKDKEVGFDETTSSIMMNGKRCALPAFKNESSLALAMFSRDIDESVDWSIIYREMTGSEAVIGTKKNKKTLVDTINRLNGRIKKIFETEDKLISCENKSVKRNY
jgi:hypothetical protein